MSLKLAIVGSSALTSDQEIMTQWLAEMILLYYQRFYGESLEFVSGGAGGVDYYSEKIADSLDIPKKIFQPDVRQWEGYWTYRDDQKIYLKGFKDRNLEIATYCNSLVCIRSTSSQTYGSGWTYDQAKLLGRTVRRIFI